MAKAFSSFAEYLESVHGTYLRTAVDSYIRKKASALRLYTNEIPVPWVVMLDSMSMHRVVFREAEAYRVDEKLAAAGDDFTADGPCTTLREWPSPDEDTVLFTVTESVRIRILARTTGTCSVLQRCLSVDCSARLRNGLHDLSVNRISESSERVFDRENTLSPTLVPYIYGEDLDAHAERFLRRYCPDAIDHAMPLPVDNIVRAMGLSVMYAPLPEGILAKTYFRPDNVYVYDRTCSGKKVKRRISQGTILIDPDKIRERGLGTLYLTIIHECVHWALHRKYFELQNLLTPDNNAVSCSVSTETDGKSQQIQDDLKWMEWQANALSPRIMISVTGGRMKFSEIMNRLYDKFSVTDYEEYDSPLTAFEIFAEYGALTAEDIDSFDLLTYGLSLEELSLKEAMECQPRPRLYSEDNWITGECAAGTPSPGEMMELAIKEFASFFKISLQAAKIRVSELGYEQADGAFNYIDGKHCAPYSFKSGSLEPGQTFCIDRASLAYCSRASDFLQDAVGDGRYLYVNGLVVINSPEYVRFQEGKGAVLTRYALVHADECCLVFDKSREIFSRYTDDVPLPHGLCRAEYACCFLERSIDSKSYINDAVQENAEASVRETAAEIARELATLPHDFAGSLVRHINRKAFTIELLEQKSGIGVRTLRRYRNDPNCNPPLPSVLALCVGMNLQPSYSYDLLRKAGYHIRDSQRYEDIIYCYLIDYLHMESIYEWNEQLRKAGVSQRLPSNKKPCTEMNCTNEE